MAKKSKSESASVAVDIGIAEADRKAIADGLNALLADNYGLYLKTHAFHWNVTGPMFQTLHLMFETQYNELWLANDLIAERIRALGFHVKATYSAFSKLSSIPEADGVPEATDMVRELVKGHEAAARTARSIFPRAEKGGDESTVDLLTQRLQIHEKTAWMLRSLVQ
ncbi:MAG: DNA starvation/stationary phase protection protein [Archangium gephyra]|uniref:DNA starvation/stationary phase protection protein n=1 Tax=Archangium gephyra TaxID=48 RepID=A0A2W5TAY1_9BACT|nr:MAG: DNA starvation/stationary phase protection protein [Archangium gephyra]